MDHAAPKKIDFSDLEDGEFGGSAAPIARKTDAEMMDAAAPRVATNLAQTTPAADAEVSGQMFRSPCRKCGGTGSFRGWSGRTIGSCFACGGKGYKLTKTDVEGARVRKIQKQRADVATFAATYPAIYAELQRWMALPQGGHGFLAELWDKLQKYGSLTDGQIAAVQRGIDKYAERKAHAVAQAAAAPSVAATINPLRDALLTAKASGLKRVRLSTPQFTFSLAKDSSKNPGCIYVKAGEAYLGKITPEGRLQTSYDGRASEAAIVEVCKDPLAAAKLYGIETGRCGCCGRELTDPESIAAGIGPVCAGRFGW